MGMFFFISSFFLLPSLPRIDPQSHTQRGVSLKTVVHGIQNALNDAKKKWGITSLLIPNFLRHLSEKKALETFDNLLEYSDFFVGFGLDSSEKGLPTFEISACF